MVLNSATDLICVEVLFDLRKICFDWRHVVRPVVFVMIVGCCCCDHRGAKGKILSGKHLLVGGRCSSLQILYFVVKVFFLRDNEFYTALIASLKFRFYRGHLFFICKWVVHSKK